MKIHFWTILAYSIFCTISIDSKFGLLTVTHSGDGDYSIIENYLKLYAQTECYTQMISEINIVWNNQLLPQQTFILKNNVNWKIPVYFYLPTFNSMDHRYRLPKQSTANLLYSLNDDVVVDCQTLKATFEEYKKMGNGKLGKIVSYQVSGFKFEPIDGQDGQFQYQEQSSAHYFTISEPGAAFIPRHYLQLYYLRIVEFLELRNEVINQNNCEDIFLNAIVQHFYPELPAIYIPVQKGYRNTNPKKGQSRTKQSQFLRSKCITDISSYFGYNPLRYYSKISSQISQNWKLNNNTLQIILQQKIRGVSDIEVQIVMQKNVEEYLTSKEKALKQQKQFQQNRKKYEWRSNLLKNLQEKPNKWNKKTNKQLKIESQSKSIKQGTTQLSFQTQAIILISTISILSFVIVQFYKKNCSKKNTNGIHINEDDQNQLSATRITQDY